MRKILISVSLLAGLCVEALAQDAQQAAMAAAQAIMDAPEKEEPVKKPVYWTNSVTFDLGFNQTGLWNWAAGGYKTISLQAGLDASANYAKELLGWKNRLQLQYGFLWSEDKKEILQKSGDRIYLESGLSYKTAEESKWSYTASFDFRTQFTEGYDKYEQIEDKWVGNPVSNFLAPGYINLALGMQWKPAAWFDLNLAPVTGGVVLCTDERFREKYAMPLKDGIYSSALFQFGAQLKGNVSVSVNDKFKFESQLVLFYDYLYDYKNPNISKFPVRVNWDNKITWQVARFFKIGFDTWMIYDPIVTINDVTSKLQFKEFLSINFTYTIDQKKK